MADKPFETAGPEIGSVVSCVMRAPARQRRPQVGKGFRLAVQVAMCDDDEDVGGPINLIVGDQRRSTDPRRVDRPDHVIISDQSVPLPEISLPSRSIR